MKQDMQMSPVGLGGSLVSSFNYVQMFISAPQLKDINHTCVWPDVTNQALLNMLG